MTKKSSARRDKESLKRDEIKRLQAAIGLLHMRVRNLEQAMLDKVPAEEQLFALERTDA